MKIRYIEKIQRRITTTSGRIRLRTDGLVVEDLWVTTVGIASPQLPHIKEGLPVDEGHQAVEVVIFENTRAQELGTHWKQKQTFWGPFENGLSQEQMGFISDSDPTYQVSAEPPSRWIKPCLWPGTATDTGGPVAPQSTTSALFFYCSPLPTPVNTELKITSLPAAPTSHLTFSES